MAIIIPSKNIYEINNQKVVDNEVDNIEVSAKRIEETRDYSVNVYNNDFDVVTYQQGAETSDIHEEYRLHTQAPTSYCAVSGVFKPFYVDIDVVVNKQIGNKIITQIKTGEDKTDETANIKYSTACIKKSAPISATYNTSESGRHDPSFANIQYTYPDDGEEGVFNLPKTITVQHNYSDISLSEITVNLNDETNLKDIGGTIKIIETNDYFSFRCHLLCGEEIYELKGDAVGPPTNRSTASGTATIYIPQKISLTVYGNTIGIDLKDETVKIENGQHVYSFSGNELMQTSNSPTIEESYSRVKNDWEIGKELATIKCFIDDYYAKDFNTDFIIRNIEEYHGDAIFDIRVYRCGYIKPNEKIYWNGEENPIIVSYATFDESGKVWSFRGMIRDVFVDSSAGTKIPEANKLLPCVVSLAQVVNATNSTEIYGLNKNTIAIGDEVIPYIMGPEKQEKPMSLYLDKKTPKEFKVIGKGIVADGEIAQALVLQEISLFEKGMVFLENNGELSSGEELTRLEVFVRAGKISVGDVLEYNEETATVTDIEEENLYEITVLRYGEFHNAETILAKKVKT